MVDIVDTFLQLDAVRTSDVDVLKKDGIPVEIKRRVVAVLLQLLLLLLLLLMLLMLLFRW